MRPDTLQTLADRAAIIDLTHRYAWAVDDRDWAGLRACFTDEIETAGAFHPDDADNYYPYSAVAWVDRLERVLSFFDRTQHTMSGHLHEIAGDRATCRYYVLATHFYRPQDGRAPSYTSASYTTDLVRSAGEWRIRRYRLNPIGNHGGHPPKPPATASGRST